MPEGWYWMVASLLMLFFLVVVILLLVRKLKLIGERLAAVESQSQEALRGLNADIGALCSGASGMGDHIARLEQQLRRLHERQDQLEMRDPVDREYHQAAKMIRNGAGIDELVSSCGLVRAEAELLLMLHGGKGGGTDSRQVGRLAKKSVVTVDDIEIEG